MNICFYSLSLISQELTKNNIQLSIYSLWCESPLGVKDEVEFWSCDFIVKETVWNRPEKLII